MRVLVAILAAVSVIGPACAAEPTAPPLPSAQDLAVAIRTLLLNHLPNPLTSAEPGWGKQVPALVDPDQMRNHGAWRKYKVTALNPAQP